MEFSKKDRQQQRLDKLRKESLEAQQEHESNQVQHEQISASRSSSSKNKFIIGGSIGAVLLVGIIAFSLMSSANDKFDDFANCLTEKGAVVYGNDHCSFTQKQLSWFGNSRDNLNYVKCAENKELCDSKSVKVTPTWEINGAMYPEVQTFERLSALTGCSIFNMGEK